MALLPDTEYLHDRTHNYRLAIYFAADSAKRLLDGVSIYQGYMTEDEVEIFNQAYANLQRLMQSTESTPIQAVLKAGV